MTTDPPPPPRETWHFDTARVGRRVLVFDVVGSTNTVAAEFGRADPNPDGLVVLAENQTAGRGRFGRVWRSRPGGSLLMSVVLTLPPELRRPVVVTAWAAVAAGNAVFALAGVQATIKWPNDLLVGGKKVCGILIEQGGGGDAPIRTVVGIGLNLNQSDEEFAAAGLPEAASLAAVAGRPIDLRDAAGAMVRSLDAEYSRLLAGERVAVEADWKGRMGLLGRRVVISLTDGATVTGRLSDMGFDGLTIERPGALPLVLAPETVEHVLATT